MSASSFEEIVWNNAHALQQKLLFMIEVFMEHAIQ